MSNKLGIAVSGKSGCGNSTVSGLLSEKLGFDLINYTFRTMAREMGIGFDELRALAQEDYGYDLKLDKKQIELAEKGDCVLGSRLAVWLFTEADFTVYLYASPENRAKRIQTREGGDYEEIFHKTVKRDNDDQERYKNIYEIDTEDYSHVDLVINTEHFSIKEEVELILSALRIRGLID